MHHTNTLKRTETCIKKKTQVSFCSKTILEYRKWRQLYAWNKDIYHAFCFLGKHVKSHPTDNVTSHLAELFYWLNLKWQIWGWINTILLVKLKTVNLRMTQSAWGNQPVHAWTRAWRRWWWEDRDSRPQTQSRSTSACCFANWEKAQA